MLANRDADEELRMASAQRSLQGGGLILSILRKRQDGREYLDLVNAIMVALDRNGNVIFINRAGCKLLDCRAGDVIGKNWFTTFLPEDIRREVFIVFRDLMHGKVRLRENFENPILRSDGTVRVISWHNTRFKDKRGRPMGTLSAGIDVTSEREMKKNLKDEKAKSDMYFDFLAHDIANMISPIKIYSEIIGLDDIGSAETRRIIKKMAEQAEMASKFIRNLKRLDAFRRLDTLETAEADAFTVVRDVGRTIRLRFRDKIVRIKRFYSGKKPIRIKHAESLRCSLEALLEIIAKNSSRSEIPIEIRITHEDKEGTVEGQFLKISLHCARFDLPADIGSLITHSDRAWEKLRHIILSDVELCILLLSRCNGRMLIENIKAKERSSIDTRLSLIIPIICKEK